MPAALSYPGVYVEEISSGVRTITGVATSVAAFIGRAAKGPVDKAVDITSFGDFERIFGGLWSESALGFAVRDFFLNGGARAVIVRLFNNDGADEAAAQVTAVESIIAAAKGGANGKAASDAAKAANKTVQDDQNASAATKKAAQAASDLIATLANDADANAINAKLADVKATEPKPASRQIKVGKLVFAPISQGSWGGFIRILVTSTPGSLTTKNLASDLGLDPAQLFNLTVADLAPGGITETYENVTVEDTVNRIDLMLEGSALIQWAGGDLTANKPDITAFVPTPPATTLVTGDDGFGQKYVDLLKARADNPDPTTKAVVDATTAYQKALKDTFTGLSDGNLLASTDFLKPGGEDAKTGLYALEQLYTRDGIFNLLCIPPYKADKNVDTGVIAEAGAYCEKRRAVLIVDAPTTWNSVSKAIEGFSADPDQVGYRGRNGALFFPRLSMPNPFNGNRLEDYAACGVAAGLCARTDTERGVWKSPAGIDTSLLGVASLSIPMTDAENGLLNPLGINCLRRFPVYGAISWGARTLRGADAFADEYKYLAVRRTALYIEESLYRALKWVVFEPNDEPLWAQIRLNVGAFMHNLFRQHAFKGQSASDAYYVKCDGQTTTQNDINLGIVNINVGFAPLKPAEFVVLQLQQIAGSIEA